MRWLVGIVWCIVAAALGGIIYGGWGAIAQQRLITTAQPVPGVVLGQRLETQKVRSFVLYMPAVDYKYTVDGKDYQSDTTYPTEDYGRKEEAEAVLNRFPVDAEVSVFIAPHDPAQSFLIHQYGPDPYLAILASFIVLCMGLAGVDELQTRSQTLPTFDEELPGNVLIARNGKQQEARMVAKMVAIGLIFGTPIGLHYIVMTFPLHNRLFAALFAGYNLAGISFGCWATWHLWIRRGFGKPQVAADTSTPTLGRIFNLQLTQPIHFAGTINRLSLDVILQKQNKSLFDAENDDDSPDPVLFRWGDVLVEDLPVSGIETLDYTLEVLLPADLRPSTPPTDRSKWHDVWTVRLRGEGSGGRIVDTDFNLFVSAQERR